MINWFKGIPWDAIVKAGLAIVFSVVLLIVFIHILLTSLENQTKMQEANTAIAVSQEKVANAIDDLGGNVKDFAEQTDDVGDALRELNNQNKDLTDNIKDVLEHVRSK